MIGHYLNDVVVKELRIPVNCFQDMLDYFGRVGSDKKIISFMCHISVRIL